MEKRDTIEEELRNAGTTLVVCDDPYTVSNAYFESLYEKILVRIHETPGKSVKEELDAISSFLTHAPRNTPYLVPGDYPLLSASLQLESMPNNNGEILNPYEAPKGFFETFPKKVILAIQDNYSTVVYKKNRKWGQQAWAAVTIGIIALGFLFWYKKSIDIDPVSQPYAWTAKSMKKVSTDDLNGFINMTDVPYQATSASAKKNTTVQADVRNLLHEVPDQDVDQFLKEVESVEYN